MNDDLKKLPTHPEHLPPMPTREDCAQAGEAQYERATAWCGRVGELATEVLGVPCDATFVVHPHYRVYFGMGEKMKFYDFTPAQLEAYCKALEHAKGNEVLETEMRSAFNS